MLRNAQTGNSPPTGHHATSDVPLSPFAACRALSYRCRHLAGHLALAQPAAPPAKAPASLHGNATESLRNLKANRGSTTKHGHRRMAMPPHRYGITGKPSPGRQFANKPPAGKPPRRGHCLQQQKWTATDSHRCRPLKIYNPKIHTSFSNEKGGFAALPPSYLLQLSLQTGFYIWSNNLSTFLTLSIVTLIIFTLANTFRYLLSLS